MKSVPDNYYELAIVDPPFGINITKSGRLKRYNTDNTTCDNGAPTKEYFDELFRISSNQIIWGGNYFIDNLYPTRCFIIWDKKQPQNVSFASCEFAWTSFDASAKTFYMSPMGQKDRIHSCQKPIQLYEWLLTNYAKQCDKIFDSHFGSLSIGIACHNLGFKLDACELDIEYYQKSLDRLKFHQRQMNLFETQEIKETEVKQLNIF